MLVSLGIVFVMLVYVVPLRLLAESAFHYASGGRLPGAALIGGVADLQTLYVAYGLGFAVLAALYVGLYGLGLRDAVSGPAAAELRQNRLVWAVVAVSGLLSAGVASLGPALAAAPWLPGMVYWIIPVGLLAIRRLDRGPAATASA